MLQCGGLSIEIGAKVHMDTSAIHSRPQGEKRRKMDGNPSIRSILELILLPIHKTRGVTPYGAVEKNLDFSGGL